MFTPGALSREDQCVIAADSGDEVPRAALLETCDRNCFVMGAPAYEAHSEAHTLHTQDSDVGTPVCRRRGHPPCLAPERALLCELAFGESDGARALCGVRGAGPTALRRVATRSWPWGRMAVAEEGGRAPAPRAEPRGRRVLSRRTVARRLPVRDAGWCSDCAPWPRLTALAEPLPPDRTGRSGVKRTFPSAQFIY